MKELLELTENWTDELGPFTLKNDGVAVDLAGLIVTLVLRDDLGNVAIRNHHGLIAA